MTAYDLAQRFIGIKEVTGVVDNPMIMSMLRLDQSWPQNDEVPWCSAFVNYICWLMRLPRSKDLRARSWLKIGREITLDNAVSDSDIVIFTRAGFTMDPNVIDAPGHVAFFSSYIPRSSTIEVLGGNQVDSVCVSNFKVNSIISVRRLI